MDFAALTEHLTAQAGGVMETLTWHGREYQVMEPGRARFLRCAQYLAAGSIEDPTARSAARRDALGGESLAVVALGREVADALEAADVPVTVVNTYAMALAVRWVHGTDRANAYIEQLTGAGSGESEGKAPSGSRSRRKSGTATASASKIPRRASGPTTGSR